MQHICQQSGNHTQVGHVSGLHVFYCGAVWRQSDFRSVEPSTCLWGIEPINCQETGAFAGLARC